MKIALRRIITIAYIAVITVMPPCIGQEQLVSEEQFSISKLLFPESTHWIPYNQFTSLTTQDLEPLKAELSAAFRKAYPDWNEAFCSFMERSLEEAATGNFYQTDIDHDGRNDIIYIGTARCSEGDSTFIWYASPEGYEIRQPQVGDLSKLLRISPNGQWVTTIKAGCCGDHYNRYFIGPIRNPRQHDIWVNTLIEFPSSRFDTPRPLRTSKRMVLHSKPVNAPEFDEVGTPIEPYAKGSHGVALAQRVIGGRKWLFVKMHRMLPEKGSVAPDFGWLPSKHVRIVQK